LTIWRCFPKTWRRQNDLNQAEDFTPPGFSPHPDLQLSEINSVGEKKERTMNPLIQLKQTTSVFVLILMLACFALSPQAQAVTPAPDGGYPLANTAEGTNALFHLTSGIANTAVGFNALHYNTAGGYNVAVGSSALANNITGNFNMAIGTDALRDNNASLNLAIGFRVGYLNTTGSHLTGIGALALRNNTTGDFNTAIGAGALRENTTSSNNTAVGADALLENSTGTENTATGFRALYNNDGDYNTATGSKALRLNTDGSDNTATGFGALFYDQGDANTANGSQALYSNTSGGLNTATGFQALYSNTMGDSNTAVGNAALSSNTTGDSNNAIGNTALTSNTTGIQNNAFGYSALLLNVTGNNNTAIGDTAGAMITGSGNVCIGEGVQGVAGEDDTTRIRNIYDSVATDRAVYVNSDNKLGTMASSRRFKDEIKPMKKTSEALFALNPVTFRYRKEIDPKGISRFGLVAEDVEKVNPDLIVRDKEGKPYSVRYDAVNAMLLNEFLKAHRKMEQQDVTIARQQEQIESLTAGLQKVSAQLATDESLRLAGLK
jgi:hypothetical protein